MKNIKPKYATLRVDSSSLDLSMPIIEVVIEEPKKEKPNIVIYNTKTRKNSLELF